VVPKTYVPKGYVLNSVISAKNQWICVFSGYMADAKGISTGSPFISSMYYLYTTDILFASLWGSYWLLFTHLIPEPVKKRLVDLFPPKNIGEDPNPFGLYDINITKKETLIVVHLRRLFVDIWLPWRHDTH